MARSNKTQSVSELRKVLYDQVDFVGTENYEYKKANAISQAAAQIFTSYRLQLDAMKLSGRKLEAGKLEGLLDS